MIPKNLAWILGLVGALAVIVPSFAPDAEKAASAEESAKAAPAKKKLTSAEETSDEVVESETSESVFSDSEINASNFGSPEESDALENIDDQNAPASTAQQTRENLPAALDKQSASENPPALEAAGLKNGSGGKISVTAEEIENARKF